MDHHLFAEKLGRVYCPAMLATMETWWSAHRGNLAGDIIAGIAVAARLHHDPAWERSDDPSYARNQRLIERVLEG